MNHYTPEGFIRMGYGYTLMGTGWSLWTYGRHYELTDDAEWLAKTADKIAKACRWVERQVQMTKKLDPYGGKVPEYGLVPPGVSADWNAFSYRFKP